MSPIGPALASLADKIARRARTIGRDLALDISRVTDRTGELALGPPGRVSPNGSCRLIQAKDGWIAVNLARATDREMLPAWLGAEAEGDPWVAPRHHGGDGPFPDDRELPGVPRVPVAGVGLHATARLKPDATYEVVLVHSVRPFDAHPEPVEG